MDNQKYAMVKSYEHMVDEINDILSGTVYSVEERQRLFYVCGTCLHWILDYAERTNVSEENKKIISAFRFANNALKHNLNLYELTVQTGGLDFPIEFPVSVETKVIKWKELEDSGRYKNQYDNYVTYLQGKAVVESCKMVINILLNV